MAYIAHDVACTNKIGAIYIYSKIVNQNCLLQNKNVCSQTSKTLNDIFELLLHTLRFQRR